MAFLNIDKTRQIIYFLTPKVMKRRDFVKVLAASGIALTTSNLLSCAGKSDQLNILILGGTYFVGPAIVNAALANHHKVTLFNRGITPQLFSEIKLITGDREQGPEAYETQQKEKWDVVIDVWPEHSKLVDEATSALAEYANHYVLSLALG